MPNTRKFFFFFFGLVRYTCTWWVLNPQPHWSTQHLQGEEVPVELEIIGNIGKYFYRSNEEISKQLLLSKADHRIPNVNTLKKSQSIYTAKIKKNCSQKKCQILKIDVLTQALQKTLHAKSPHCLEEQHLKQQSHQVILTHHSLSNSNLNDSQAIHVAAPFNI